ncbi:MAG: efflux RND transporter permease subunit [Acidobacteria bacterium]|nr:efflux RND transporter permease subunit [Acidobacteriota bacterium]
MLHHLVHAALRQRIVIAVLAVILLLFGLDATRKLSVDAFPDVTNVQVQVATVAPGRSPEEVERFITVPIEISMTGLPGMVEMRSLNKPGLSLLTIVFTDETQVYFARQVVMERLSEVRESLPGGVTPVLGPVATAMSEVYHYTIEKPTDGKRALTKEELVERRTVQDWVVRPLLRSIPGVAEINSTGGYIRQYQVLTDPARLRQYGITLQQVCDALAKNNANSGGGVVSKNAEQYLVRGVGLIKTLDDIGMIILKEERGTPVYVRDVAEVKLGEEVRYGAMIQGGYTEAAGGTVFMMAGGNAKQVVTRVKARVQEINEKKMLPGGMQLVSYYDRSALVDAALNTVEKVLLEGIVLVVVVLFLFLGDLRSSLIVIATLLLTPVVTFIVMNHYGMSANLMSLGGLAIAIGLIVDGSVVVVENAFTRLGRPVHESRVRTVHEAVMEVGIPVIFGIGVIIIVFLPLMTLEGMEGKMFAPLAYTIAIALGISLVLSLTLTPVLSSYMLKGGREHDTWLVAGMKKPYLRLLEWSLRNWKTTMAAALALFASAVLLFPYLGTSFIPEMKEGSLSPNMHRVPNISIEESIRMEMEAMRIVSEIPGVTRVVSRIGRGGSPADPVTPDEAEVIATLAPLDRRPAGWTQEAIGDEMRKRLAHIPGVNLVIAQPISDRVDEMVTGVRADVAVKLFGDDLQLLIQKANEIARVAGTVRGLRDTKIEKLGGQQYLNVEVDRYAIARHGLNASDVHDVIETAIGGKDVTEIFEGERRFQAAVRFPVQLRDSLEEIRHIEMNTPSGGKVLLENVAKIELAEGPAMINREMAKRRIVVGLNVKDRDLGGFVAELQQKVKKVELPPGYYITWGGQFQNMERAMKHLMVIVPVTVGLIYFLLFLLFRSLRISALIILVLPFASIGGVFALWLSGEYLSVPASVGFIALWGIAVLNGVVLVSYIRNLREGQMERHAAIVEGARLRFRPVMMTATVAALGLVPFLFATGPGSEVQRPLAIVVIGGLITSTLLTLVVLPTLYRFFDAPDSTTEE